MPKNETEQRMVAEAVRLRELASAPSLSTEEIKRACAALLEQARKFLQVEGQALQERTPELKARIEDRLSEETPVAFKTAPVVLYGAATPEQVLAAWTQQLREGAKGVAGMLLEEPAFAGEWGVWPWGEVDEYKDRLPFFNAVYVRDYVKDLAKLATLLSLAPAIKRLERGRILFEARGPASPWKTYGEGEFKWENDRLTVFGQGCSFSPEQAWEDAVVSLEFLPHALEGVKNGGVLFAYPAKPVSGFDFSSASGPMGKYNFGIETYHCSLFRGLTGRTNLRRTGKGLRMLSTVLPDPCAVPGMAYRVEFLKFGPAFQVYVEGKLIHSYVDVGSHGAPLAGGRFAVRHFSGDRLRAEYGDFKVNAL